MSFKYLLVYLKALFFVGFSYTYRGYTITVHEDSGVAHLDATVIVAAARAIDSGKTGKVQCGTIVVQITPPGQLVAGDYGTNPPVNPTTPGMPPLS